VLSSCSDSPVEPVSGPGVGVGEPGAGPAAGSFPARPGRFRAGRTSWRGGAQGAILRATVAHRVRPSRCRGTSSRSPGAGRRADVEFAEPDCLTLDDPPAPAALPAIALRLRDLPTTARFRRGGRLASTGTRTPTWTGSRPSTSSGPVLEPRGCDPDTGVRASADLAGGGRQHFTTTTPMWGRPGPRHPWRGSQHRGADATGLRSPGAEHRSSRGEGHTDLRPQRQCPARLWRLDHGRSTRRRRPEHQPGGTDPRRPAPRSSTREQRPAVRGREQRPAGRPLAPGVREAWPWRDGLGDDSPAIRTGAGGRAVGRAGTGATRAGTARSRLLLLERRDYRSSPASWRHLRPLVGRPSAMDSRPTRPCSAHGFDRGGSRRAGTTGSAARINVGARSTICRCRHAPCRGLTYSCSGPDCVLDRVPPDRTVVSWSWTRGGASSERNDPCTPAALGRHAPRDDDGGRHQRTQPFRSVASPGSGRAAGLDSASRSLADGLTGLADGDPVSTWPDASGCDHATRPRHRSGPRFAPHRWPVCRRCR
jgi:hypothetical protein